MSLSRRTSLHARQVIQKAFQELEHAVAVPEARRFRDTTIQDVQKACESIENELAARGLLRNMGRLQPLLKGLECYGMAAQTLCQGTPYLPWIWAPIVVILQIGSDCIAAFEILIKAYARIGTSLGRFEKLRNAFADDLGFQEIVAIFYRDIVKFHERAYKFVTVNGWRIFFRTTWGRFDRHFSVILESLAQHSELIDKEANTRNVVETQALLKQLDAGRKKNLEMVEVEEKAEVAKQYRAILARLQVNEADQNSIWETLVGALRAGHEGTCSWVLKHEKVASWLNEKGNTRSLWLQGSAGTGKSVIAAHLAKFRSLDNHIVIRHFCNDLYNTSTEYDQILKSIIRQLLERSDDSTAYVYKALIIERKPLTVSTLETVIQEIVSILSGSTQERRLIWIMIDGVDACEDASLARFVALMDVIAMKDGALGTATCKVLFTSRREPHKMQARKRPLVLLRKENSHLRSSIQLYAVQRLQSPLISERLAQLGIETDGITDLGHEIAAKADGMFLYARLIVDYLSKQLFRTSWDLRRAIQELPPELKGFYRKLLSNIVSHLNPISTESVKCVLYWIGFSKSPLKQLEILSAVTFSEGATETDRLVPSFFLQDCSSLLEEKCDKTIGFIHASVKEFLLDPDSPISIKREEAQRQHRLAILACIASAARYFSQLDSDPNRHIRVVRGVFALLNYASKHWTEYVLSYAKTCSRSGVYDTQYVGAIEGLANSLDRLVPVRNSLATNSPALDPLLESLQNFPSIRPHVEMALKFRSQEAIDKVSVENDQKSSVRGPPIDAVSIILQKYRDTVLWLLSQDCYDGVSREDFQLFRSQAQTSLFTCRLPSCPSASIGYPTEAELRAHELEHTKKFPCRVSGCHYPPFRCAQMLENHFKKHHHQVPLKRTLRRVGGFCNEPEDVPVDSLRRLGQMCQVQQDVGPRIPGQQGHIMNGQRHGKQMDGPQLGFMSSQSPTPSAVASTAEGHSQGWASQSKASTLTLAVAPWLLQQPSLQQQQYSQRVQPPERYGQMFYKNYIDMAPMTLPTFIVADSAELAQGGQQGKIHAAGDERIPMQTDEFGEKKVLPNGELLGGRQYLCRTFLLPNHGYKLFMLGMECARVLGYRDTYLLFNKNRSLDKIIASQLEKDDLACQEILPFSYRSREIAMVTARSMFCQFGSAIIVDGRRVRDDYWETKAKKQGFTENDLPDKKRPGGGYQIYKSAQLGTN